MANIPSTTRRIIVTTLSQDFRKATEIRDEPIQELEPKSVLLKLKYVGVNATDINLTAGRYFIKDPPPFPCGMEGIGEIVKVGAGSKYKVGQCAAVLSLGCYTEYLVVDEGRVAPMPTCDPALICVMLSGPTASISIEKEGDLKEGQTVLVTGAAGGTGMFAVQLAKLAGCHVIGTCGSPDKIEFLKSIGCDRPINYKSEDLNAVLKKEYPNGVNVVYECIGKKVFEAALANLAPFGRIIAIGQISNYQQDSSTLQSLKEPECSFPITLSLIRNSASIRGFILTMYPEEQKVHIPKLVKLYMEGKLKLKVDLGENDSKGPFKGLEQVADAIDYMYAGKNFGKLIVEL